MYSSERAREQRIMATVRKRESEKEREKEREREREKECV